MDAYYGPKWAGDLAGDLADVFELRGDVVADLTANYVNPVGKANVSAEFPDSNLGNGVECRIITWQDGQSYDVIGTFNTKDLTVAKCGTASFKVPIAVGKVGEHIDFVLHNAGNHVCDATAIRIRVLTNVRKPIAQTSVTKVLQSQYHNRLVTPLGSYKSLFGDAAPGQDKTLKVKVSLWQHGIVKYLEFAPDAPLDLTSSNP